MSSITQAAANASLRATPVSAQSANKATLTAWVAVLAGMIGAFMAILNIQITNASLLDIEGGIGTGVDNGAWISTSYLIGEIVVIPLTDYMSRVFSFRRYMLANVVLFALFSAACAFAHDLGSMIGLRRRRADSHGLHHGADEAPQVPAADWPCDVCDLGHFRSGHRPNDRRLPDRELRLADHLLRQRAAEPGDVHRALFHAREETDA